MIWQMYIKNDAVRFVFCHKRSRLKPIERLQDFSFRKFLFKERFNNRVEAFVVVNDNDYSPACFRSADKEKLKNLTTG